MAFQKTVNRQYTQGWLGEILNDGPVRAKPGRIVNGGVGAINRIGRAFGVAGDVDPGKPSGTSTVASKTNAFIEQTAKVGGSGFFGILGAPKHYALFGTSAPAAGEQPGPLSPTIDLPDDVEGEFFDMAIMAVACANGSSTDAAIPFGSKVYYCISAATTANYVTTTVADLGRLFVFPAAAVAGIPAAVFAPVPNAQLTVVVGGNWVSNTDVQVRIQMTN